MKKSDLRKIIKEEIRQIKIIYEKNTLINKIVKRKGSNIEWQVWAEDEDTISLMSYNTAKPMSRRVKKSVFKKNWIKK